MSSFDDEILAAHLNGIEAALGVIERRARERMQRKAAINTMAQSVNHGIDTLTAGIKWRSEMISELQAYAKYLHTENLQLKGTVDSQRMTIWKLERAIAKSKSPV